MLNSAEIASGKIELAGVQPRALKAIDTDAPAIGVLGCGDIYQKHIRACLDHRGLKRLIFDPRAAEILAPNAYEEIVDSEAALLARKPAAILVLSTADHHARQIIAALDAGVPVLVEKPLTASAAEARRLQERLERPHPPLYCMDWAVEQAKPLFMALGLPVHLGEAVRMTEKDRAAFADFDFAHLARINARRVVTDDPLPQLSRTATGRDWLLNPAKGGGMVYDNGVHLFNVLGALGFMPGILRDARLGAYDSTDPPGRYRPIGIEGGNRVTGETYFRATLDFHKNGASIPAEIEVGWHGAKDDCSVEFTDARGRRLRWDIHPSAVTLFSASGQRLAHAELCGIDCYAGLLDEGLAYARGGPQEGYADAHAAMIPLAEAIHAHARARPAGPVLYQHAMAEGWGMGAHKSAFNR